MPDIKSFDELDDNEKDHVIQIFIDHELENFDDSYTTEEAMEVLKDSYHFLPIYKRGGLVDVKMI